VYFYVIGATIPLNNMSRPLDIEVRGGNRDCFSNICPIYLALLQHLEKAPFTNVYRKRLKELENNRRGLLRVNTRSTNATLTCDVSSCPLKPQERFSNNPSIVVKNIQPDRSSHSLY
jgi:hypothetical protein